mmetsp:Transcript_6213/g.9365  ORF Transcript_6213/g.9365 Transcript_6213/m.9365 type:complete len:755 (+) Transcript_6213:104-2368(+)
MDRRTFTSVLSIVVLISTIWSGVLVNGECPNNCNGKGSCLAEEAGLCKCFPGYHGVDCSQRLCPAGVAWFDHPYADNMAHAEFTECSNMGVCNRKTGECECRRGFSGAACDQLACPLGTATKGGKKPCSGHGRCVSLRTISNYVDYEEFTNATVYADWDADMVYGCDCNSGWEGSTCARRSCPKGDNPSTPGVDEVQLIDCTCTDFDCQGTFQLSVRGLKTQSMPLNITEEVIKYRIQQLSSVDDVAVDIIGERFCRKDGSTTLLRFKLPQGDYPAVEIVQGSTFEATASVFVDGDSSVVNPAVSSVLGTREYVECSDHGSCNYISGACQCFAGYGSSNGFGEVGTRGDCGYQFSTNTTQNVNGTEVITGCPYEYNGINSTKLFCSGHGTCNFHLGTCTCDDGYEGAGCLKKTCPVANAWFGSVEFRHSGNATCAGVGQCNYVTGLCEKCGGDWNVFSGDACQYLSCYEDSNGVSCGGNGQCLSLREVADLTYGENKELTGVVYNTPWDADMVRGCSCYRSWTVDNQYSADYYPFGHFTKNRLDNNYNQTKFYRGPTAFAATDWIGYDCLHAACPTGLDPTLISSRIADNEIQMFQCDANNGTFQLTFRGNTTRAIPYTANASDLESYLEELYTINDVEVTIIGPETTICESSNVTIEFKSEFGDLPLLVLNSTVLDHTMNNHFGRFLANVTELRAGTKVDVECSAMGLCDQDTGRCQCMEGYSSSDGTLTSPGERGDCSYYNPYYTVRYDGST